MLFGCNGTPQHQRKTSHKAGFHCGWLLLACLRSAKAKVRLVFQDDRHLHKVNISLPQSYLTQVRQEKVTYLFDQLSNWTMNGSWRCLWVVLCTGVLGYAVQCKANCRVLCSGSARLCCIALVNLALLSLGQTHSQCCWTSSGLPFDTFCF